MKLIDKDALVAEIEGLKDSDPYYPTLAERYAYNNGVNDAIDKIYSLEVKKKEVDLEKELDAMITPELKFHKALPSLFDVAKHFYSLGLAQKGE